MTHDLTMVQSVRNQPSPGNLFLKDHYKQIAATRCLCDLSLSSQMFGLELQNHQNSSLRSNILAQVGFS